MPAYQYRCKKNKQCGACRALQNLLLASLAQRESISLTRRGLGYRNSHGAPHMGHGDAQGVYRTCNAEIRGEHYPYGPPVKIKRQRGPVEEIANIARIAVHRARYGISSHSRYTKMCQGNRTAETSSWSMGIPRNVRCPREHLILPSIAEYSSGY